MSKTILITGASSGLGEHMARAFAARGHNLALCARRTDRLEALQTELMAAHPAIRVEIAALDVNDHAAVFTVFQQFAQAFGSLDRVVVNAGIADGRRVGTGHFETNLHTAQTNFTGALAQCEAALEIFRKQNSGHLVAISSVSAVRGMPRHLTVYAASKAGLALLMEGIQAELINTPIKITTLFPGYIRTELNEGAGKLPFELTAEDGARLLVEAIEQEIRQAFIPRWPWSLAGRAMKVLPLSLVAKLV
ncbi:MAG: SDR family oxidoreductase [Marinobacter sp.]|nr:SDR family oxidoreductase [Marinobacter sp.]